MNAAEVAGTKNIMLAIDNALNGLQNVEVAPPKKRTRTVKPKPQSVAELIDNECLIKRKSGYVKATGRKNPVLAYVSYVPFKGKRQGERIAFALLACSVVPDKGRSAFLKPIDEMGNIIPHLIYKVREWREENFASLRLGLKDVA
jgi:hypothetical protein